MWATGSRNSTERRVSMNVCHHVVRKSNDWRKLQTNGRIHSPYVLVVDQQMFAHLFFCSCCCCCLWLSSKKKKEKLHVCIMHPISHSFQKYSWKSGRMRMKATKKCDMAVMQNKQTSIHSNCILASIVSSLIYTFLSVIRLSAALPHN